MMITALPIESSTTPVWTSEPRPEAIPAAGYLNRERLLGMLQAERYAPAAQMLLRVLDHARRAEGLAAFTTPDYTVVCGGETEPKAYRAATYAAFFKAAQACSEECDPTHVSMAIASWEANRFSYHKLARRMRAFAETVGMTTVGVTYNGARRIIQYLATHQVKATMLGNPVATVRREATAERYRRIAHYHQQEWDHARIARKMQVSERTVRRALQAVAEDTRDDMINVFEAMGIAVCETASLGKILKRLRAMGTGGDAAVYHRENSHVDPATGEGWLSLPGVDPIILRLYEDREGGDTNSGSMHCSRETALRICAGFGTPMPANTARLQMWITTDAGLLKGMIVIDDNAPRPEGVDLLVARDSLAPEIAAVSVTAGKMNFWGNSEGNQILEIEGLQMAPNLMVHTGCQQLADHQREVGERVMRKIVDQIETGDAFRHLDPAIVIERQRSALRVSLDGNELRMPDAERAIRLSEQLVMGGPWSSAEVIREALRPVRKMQTFDARQNQKELPGAFAVGFKSMATDEALFADPIPEGNAAILWRKAAAGQPSIPNGVAVSARTFSVITPSMDGHDHDDSTSNLVFPGQLFQIRTPSTFEAGAMLPVSPEDMRLLNAMEDVHVFQASGTGKLHPNLHELEPVHAGKLYEDGHLKWDVDPWRMLEVVQPHLDNIGAIGMIALLVAALIHSGNFNPLEHMVSNSDIIDRVHKMDGDPWPAYTGLLDAVCHSVHRGDVYEPKTWTTIADSVEKRYLELCAPDGTPYVPETERETFRIADVVILSPNAGHEAVIEARHALIERLDRFSSRLAAYANGNHHWLVERHPLPIRAIARELAQNVAKEWSFHFRANAADDIAKTKVSQLVNDAYRRIRDLMGDDYRLGTFSACVAQSQAVQRNRFPTNVDEAHKSLALSLLGDLPWEEQICFWTAPVAQGPAQPTWRSRLRPYQGQSLELDPDRQYSVTQDEAGRALLVAGDWRVDGKDEVAGELGPEGHELIGLRNVKFLGEIPKVDADDEAPQAVILLGAPVRHVLRSER